MRSSWFMSLSVIVLAATLQAQEPAQAPPDRPGPPADRGGRGPGRLDVMAERLAEELQLTEAQRPAYDELVAKYVAQAQQAQAEQPDMRALAQELREARQNGDDARAEELRNQLRDAGAGRTQAIRDFLTEVEPLLDATQVAKLEQFRERTLRRFEAGQREAQGRDLLRRLPEELGLTEEQRQQFDALVAERRQSMEQSREQWRELRPLMDELRQARESGDQQRVAELEAQLAEKRPGPPNLDEFFAKLEPILTAEQQTKLTTLREQNAGGRRSGGLDVRAILRAAKQLKLTDAQEEQLKTIIRDAQQANRKGAADAEARTKQAELVKGQIVKILDETQAAEFQKLLDREQRPAGQQRERRGGRGARSEAGGEN